MILLSSIPVAIPSASFPPEVLLACDAVTLTIDVPEAAAFEIDHSCVLTLRLNYRGVGHRSAAVWRQLPKSGLYLTEHAVGLLHPLQQGGWLLARVARKGTLQ
jgi:hypothetical protein